MYNFSGVFVGSWEDIRTLQQSLLLKHCVESVFLILRIVLYYRLSLIRLSYGKFSLCNGLYYHRICDCIMHLYYYLSKHSFQKDVMYLRIMFMNRIIHMIKWDLSYSGAILIHRRKSMYSFQFDSTKSV